MPDLQVIESEIWKELESRSTNDLEGLVGIHFTFNENADEELIKDFYMRQQVAKSIIDRRLGRLEGRDPEHVWRDKSKDPSIWARSKRPPENSI